MLQIGSLALMSALQFNGNNQKWENRMVLKNENNKQ